MNKYAIIVAGGSGKRMGSDIPKQFLLLRGKPILLHTLDVFISYPEKINLILVLPKASMHDWSKLCNQHHFNHKIEIVVGGNSRFQSVKNGLAKIEEQNSLVAIHDGVRPLVSHQIIGDSFRIAQQKGSAIASTPLKESIRKVDGEDSNAIDRSEFRLIQTPQTFRTALIQSAFNNFDKDEGFTDDASVVEKFGARVFLFDGNFQNIKITTPEDMIFAHAIIAGKQ
jgi:2-C-methyl-D-erythritol 4-phosphate cytidylyltransferase